MLKVFRSAFIIAFYDIKSKYTGSILGPIWILINLIILTFALSNIYASLLNVNVLDYSAYIGIGFAIWWFIINTINEGTDCLILNRNLILNSNISIHFMWSRLIFKNLMIFFHCLMIYPVFLFLNKLQINNLIYLIPSILLLIIFLYLVVSIISMICVRYRDISQIIVSIMGVSTFITPILFKVEMFPDRVGFIEYNPFYHFVEIMRDPILGNELDLNNFIVAIMINLTLFLIFILIKKKRKNISLWI